MSVFLIAGIAFFGGLGAAARYLVSVMVPTSFPAGTWIVNVTGSLALGLVGGLSASGQVSTDWLTILGVGFCGGFTTFSTASVDTVKLLENKQPWLGLANLLGMALLCLAAAAAGFYVGGL